MENCINFYLNDETLKYKIKKCFGKVVFLNKQNYLVFEVESTDELDHVEEDSLQNEFPEIILSIEDFPIDFATLGECVNQKITIPNSYEEIINEDGEVEEVYYTNLNLNNEEDLETNNNEISLSKKGNSLYLNWEGDCEHFENVGETIRFKIQSEINFKKPLKDYGD